MRDLNKFKGCLVGGAIGDALGYAVEFSAAGEIFAKYGPGGITRYDCAHGKALISDDTQMTLFTATGLLFGTTRGKMRGIMGAYADYINHSYRNWLATQVDGSPQEFSGSKVSWLVNFPELYAAREPGRTCISALYQNKRGSMQDPINHSKGCGGVMRVAPIGLYFIDRPYSPDKVDLLGAEAAALTHGHELGYIPAAALVHIVRLLASGEAPDVLSAVRSAMEAMPRLFPQAEHMGEFLALMERAIALSQRELPDLDAIGQIGGGWVAEETLAIAVYCALKYPHDFEKAIVASVNHGGDSDSTGAVTGNILGAFLGYDALPAFYLKKLELRDVILEVAEDLYSDCRMGEYSEYSDPLWVSKYIDLDYDPEKRDWAR